MATRRLERCGVDKAICANLARHSIHTVGDLFSTNMLSLMVFADVSMDEIKATVQIVSERIRPTHRSALEIFNAHAQSTTSRYLSTGLREIDHAMKGGLLMGCINEIVGPPGVGKTQFCMSCCVQMLCVNERSVIYIDTELKFDPTRLSEIAQAKHPHLFRRNSADTREFLDKLMSSVEILRPKTCKELSAMISGLEDKVIERGVSLIVIDSIATPVRKDGLDERDRETYFIEHSSILKRLAELCNVCVLVTNQVTPIFAAAGVGSAAAAATIRGKSSNVLGDQMHSSWGTFQPTLGPTWHHCVSIRLTLQKLVVSGATEGSREDEVRVICITKSPMSPPLKVNFRICNAGLEPP